MIMPRVGRGRGHDDGGGRGSYLHYLEQRSLGRLRRGAGDQINRNLALSMLNPPHRCGFLIDLQEVGGWGDLTCGVENTFREVCDLLLSAGIDLFLLTLSIRRTPSMMFSIIW